MPRFNGTGPLGAGPGTGWGLGPCDAAGRGWPRGHGRKRGWGHWGYGPWCCPGYQPEITKKEEKEMLKQEAELLEEELKTIKERLAGLKGKN